MPQAVFLTRRTVSREEPLHDHHTDRPFFSPAAPDTSRAHLAETEQLQKKASISQPICADAPSRQNADGREGPCGRPSALTSPRCPGRPARPRSSGEKDRLLVDVLLTSLVKVTLGRLQKNAAVRIRALVAVENRNAAAAVKDRQQMLRYQPLRTAASVDVRYALGGKPLGDLVLVPTPVTKYAREDTTGPGCAGAAPRQRKSRYSLGTGWRNSRATQSAKPLSMLTPPPRWRTAPVVHLTRWVGSRHAVSFRFVSAREERPVARELS